MTALAITATLAVNVAATATTQTAEVRKGHILGNDTLTTADALEILKYLVGADGAIWTAEDGYNATALAAATIVSDDKPATADALEILKAIVNIENVITFTDGFHNSLFGSKTLALYKEVEKGISAFSMPDEYGNVLRYYHNGEDYCVQVDFLKQLGVNGLHYVFNEANMTSIEWNPAEHNAAYWFVPEHRSAAGSLGGGVRVLGNGERVNELDGKTYYAEEIDYGWFTSFYLFNEEGEKIAIEYEDRTVEWFLSASVPSNAFDFPQGYTVVNCIETFWKDFWKLYWSYWFSLALE